jgi:hypothetical protein
MPEHMGTSDEWFFVNQHLGTTKAMSFIVGKTLLSRWE